MKFMGNIRLHRYIKIIDGIVSLSIEANLNTSDAGISRP